MKSILFLVPDLDCGGVQKSFINLINTIDRNNYNIDVFIIRYKGLYKSLLPDNVNVIYNKDVEDFYSYFPVSVYKLIRKGNFIALFRRIFQFFVSRFDRGYGGYLMSRIIPPILKEYDVVIDEGGQSLLYFMVDKIKAKKKISFFHNDYSKWSYYYNMDKRYYPKIDNIITISNVCVESLKKWFPNIDSKNIVLMENITSVKMVEELSKESVLDMPKKGFTFLTVGRIAEQKGIDLAIESAKILKEKNIEFIWYFLGDGDKKLKQKYEELVYNYNLQNNVKFLGIRLNPYSYIKQSDIVICTSRYEGKSIALDEVKILCKPVVVTNFSTVTDQFTNNFNASICEINANSISNAIIQLIQNKSLLNKYVNNLKNGRVDNSNQIDILYKLMEF